MVAHSLYGRKSSGARKKGGVYMTRNEKKAVIEDMAEQFMNINNLEGKSMIIMVMSAYTEGKAAGREEERRMWEQRQAQASNT